MPILPIPSAAADRERQQARRHPERETLELATAGTAQVAEAAITNCYRSVTDCVTNSVTKFGSGKDLRGQTFV